MKADTFLSLLQRQTVEFYTGVPDSVLSPFCQTLRDSPSSIRHVMAANEGNAVGLAIGYHLSTGRVPLVYMQNSGIGNACNPLLSLAANGIYAIPLLLLIGWRGKPGESDEPQHIVQGARQNELLDAMGIPYEILDTEDTCEARINAACQVAIEKRCACALVLSKGFFEKAEGVTVPLESAGVLFTREKALDIILSQVDPETAIVSTTGKTSRELFELRKLKGDTHANDFLCVGGMGHCSSVALGVALARPNRNVLCIDGDGALLMHMGAIATIAKAGPKRYRHIIVNNGVYESVGGQATAIDVVDVKTLFQSVGYQRVYSVSDTAALLNVLDGFFDNEGPSMLELRVSPGSRADLGRPTLSPYQSKVMFMKAVSK